MDNGQWTMDNGQWTVDSGQWIGIGAASAVVLNLAKNGAKNA